MLNLKSIISCNINGTPLTSCNLSKRIYEYKKFLDENVKEKFLDDELFIISIQGLYGYRSGILGYLFNKLSFELSQYHNPTLLKSFLNVFISNNIEANDFEILSTTLSIISRKIPFLNIGNWDLKNYISNEYINNFIPNNSFPSIFDLKSLYLLNPLFDSGCTIISNKKHLESGFERWNIIDSCSFSNKLFNQGINWAYFESNKNGISIINFELIKNEDLYNSQFIQLLNLKNILEKKFTDNSNLVKYETFIIGDFNFEFNLRDIFQEVDKKWEMFDRNHLQILNNKDYSTTNFILYNKYYDTNSENINLNISNKTNFVIDDDKIDCIEFMYTKTIEEKEEKEEKEEIKNEVLEINDEIYIESSLEENIEENIKKEIEKVKNIEKIEDNLVNVNKNDIIITINDDYFYKNPLNKNSDDEWEAI